MRSGFTLIEVTISLVVLQLGLMVALSVMVLAGQTMTRAQTLERAVAEVQAVRDSLAREPVVASGDRTLAAVSVHWEPEPGGGYRVDARGVGTPAIVVRGNGRRWTHAP